MEHTSLLTLSDGCKPTSPHCTKPHTQFAGSRRVIKISWPMIEVALAGGSPSGPSRHRPRDSAPINGADAPFLRRGLLVCRLYNR